MNKFFYKYTSVVDGIGETIHIRFEKAETKTEAMQLAKQRHPDKELVFVSGDDSGTHKMGLTNEA